MTLADVVAPIFGAVAPSGEFEPEEGTTIVEMVVSRLDKRDNK